MRRSRGVADASSTADAAIVAMRARSGVTSPLPFGWTRFDRNTTKRRLDGSIQIDVPVNPVCPKDPIGSSSPRLAEKLESMSQPSPRTFVSRDDEAGVVIFATVSGDRTRTPWATPPSSSMRQKIATSAAVLNRPACPATPPIRRAVGSWTVPRSICMSAPSHGHPYAVHLWVGAMRARSDAGAHVSCRRLRIAQARRAAGGIRRSCWRNAVRRARRGGRRSGRRCSGADAGLRPMRRRCRRAGGRPL